MSRDPRHRLLSIESLAWILFAGVAIRFADSWLVAAGVPIRRIGSIAFTLVFSLFAIVHASSLLGWRRAIAFLITSTLVSWCFEELGVTTGLIYGHYHYGSQLGAAIGSVPIIIPLAWFMMIYCSWMVAHVLLQGTAESASVLGTVAHCVLGSAVMTSWDVVMDPGMSRTGAWTWEEGGSYFGVPFQNFLGWMVTTLTVYLAATLIFRRLRGAPTPLNTSRLYLSLPILAYSLVAVDRVLISNPPELHVVATFGMGLLCGLAVFRLFCGREPLALAL
jgi:putative membrane protein